MTAVLVIAPHPDDETLGCGGTIQWHQDQGDTVDWVIVAPPNETATGDGAMTLATIDEVAASYRFREVHNLGFPDARLDVPPIADLVQRIGEVVQKTAASILYLPHRSDAHTDHRYVFDAAAACTKWFRFPLVKRVLVYETLSESNFALAGKPFQPNVYVDISKYLERKLEILDLYKSELGPHPFPRGGRPVRALAELRGSECGCDAAEAFSLLRQLL